MATGTHRITWPAAFLAALLLTCACGGPEPAPPVRPSSQGPAAPGASPTTSPGSGPEVVGEAPADLHDVDWAKIPAPGAFCGVPELVRFDAGGEARATSTVWGQVRVLRGQRVLYGDSDGDHVDEAAVFVGCNDDGATQNEDIAVGYAVYARSGKDLVVLGTLTPRQKSQAYNTRLVGAKFAPGRITVHEKWYRINDAHCCPSGDATTAWTREGTHLTAGDPRITS